jgi:hypothetical protein
MLVLYLKIGIGETLMVLIIFLGLEINIFQHIVDHVGLMDLPARLLIELILLEKELGQI